MGPHRRTILRALALLAAGAAVNVAVAWGSVMAKGSVMFTTGYFHDPAWGSFVAAMHQSLGYNVVWAVDRPGSLLDESPEWVRRFEGSVWWDDGLVRPNTCNYAIACGWPLFALTSWRTEWQHDEMAFPGIVHWGIVLPTSPSRANVDWVPPILALKPIWPGFAINTLFYAGLLWLVFLAPFALRQTIRRRHSLCTHCGYPIGTSAVCAECGAAVLPLPPGEGRGEGGRAHDSLTFPPSPPNASPGEGGVSHS